MKYSKDWKTWKQYVTIHGDNYSGCPVGYCHYYKHSGVLTKNLLVSHQCLAKQCKKMEKNEDHPFWKERELKLAKKKEKRKREKEQFELWCKGEASIIPKKSES